MNKDLEELLQNGFNDFDFDRSKEMITKILEKLIPTISFEKFNKLVSDEMDKIIAKELKKGKTYVGGTMSYVLASDKDWNVEYAFYTQDAKGEFYRNKGVAGPYKMAFLEENSSKKLLELKKIDFELEPPKMSDEKENVKVVEHVDTIIQKEKNPLADDITSFAKEIVPEKGE